MKYKLTALIIAIGIILAFGVFAIGVQEESSFTEGNIFGNILNGFSLNAEEENSIDDRISINNLSDSQWNIIKSEGNEDNFKVIFTNLKDKKTDICFVLKDGVNPGDVDLTDKLIYDEYGNEILDDKDKTMTIKYESSKCNDDGTMKDGYHLSLTEIQSINIDDSIKIGEESLVMIYEETKEILFSISDTQNISAKLYWDINGDRSDWNNTVNDLFVNFNKDKWKFGAIHEGIEWERYKYVLSSEARIENRNGKYYFRDGSGGYKLDPSDICSKINNVTNETADCQFNSYTITKKVYDSEFDTWYNVTDKYVLEIEFYSDSFIDPSFTFENLETESTLNNLRFEPDNSTHLSLNDSSIVGYWNFDSNISQTTVYDYSDNDNDGTITNEAHFVDGGIYSGAFEFDGVDDYVDTNFQIQSAGSNGTISWWMNPDLAFNDGTTHIFWSQLTNDLAPEISAQKFSDNNFYIGFNAGGNDDRIVIAASSSNYPQNEWSHYILTWVEGGDSILYMNGINIGDNGGATTLQSPSNTLEIARMSIDSPAFFDGTIDEFIIFNRTLSAIEVNATYHNQSTRFFPQGVQEFLDQNISLGVDNKLNWTMLDFQTTLDSNFLGRIGGWNEDYGYNVSDEGLVGYWGLNNNSLFGENDSLVFDYSGEGNNGTAVGAVPTIAGRYAGAFEFDGVDDLVRFGTLDIIPANNDITITAWLKPTSKTGSVRTIIAKRDSFGGGSNLFHLAVRADDEGGSSRELVFIDEGTIKDSGLMMDNDVWQFIAYVGNSTAGKFYLDSSTAIITGNGQTGSGGTGEQLAIGGLVTEDNEYLNGTIDEVAIYNRSLSPTEIKSLYIKGIANRSYTELQEIVSGDNLFQVNDAETNFIAELTYNSSNNSFYTPILESDIQVDTFNERAFDDNDNVYRCGFIDKAGVYTMNQSIAGDNSVNCITIESDDVTLDCDGKTISAAVGGSASAINVAGTSGDFISNFTLLNCNTIGYKQSINILFVNDSFFNQNNFTSPFDQGFKVASLHTSKIYNTNINGSTRSDGFAINNVLDSHFENGTIKDNGNGADEGIEINGNSKRNNFTGFNIINNNPTGIRIAHNGADDNNFYNNILNNTQNVLIAVTGSVNYYNTTLTATTSIIGGANSGGNLWTSPTANNYSDTCTVTVTDNICDNPMNVSSGLECIGCTGARIDEHPLSFKTAGAADNEFPIFSNFRDNNASLIDSGLGLFNATVINTNGTIQLQFDDVNYSATNLTTDFNVTLSLLSAGTFAYHWNGFGNGTSANYNSSQVFFYTVNVSADNEFPLFSNFQEFPTNNSEYYTGVYQFNTTITNSNSSAGIEFNNVNFTLSNVSDVFNITFDNLGVGTYPYYFWGYGNGTDELFNSSTIRSYVVLINTTGNEITPLLNGANSNLVLTYPATTNASYDGSNQTPVTIIRNGTTVVIAQDEIVGGGSWEYNYSVLANQNFTAFETFLNLTVNQATSEVNLTLNHSEGNITITEGDSIYLNGTLITGDPGSTITLYNNGTIINGGASPLANLTTFPGVDFANITVIYTDSQNYTQSSETYYVNVTAVVTDDEFPIFTNIGFNITNGTEYFGGSYLGNATIINTNGTVQLEFNGVNITTTNIGDLFSANLGNLGVATYPFYWWSYGNGTDTNYNSSVIEYYSVVINSSLLLGISGTSPITYPTVTDVAGSDCPTELSCSLDKANQVYGVGVETFNYSTAGNTNYSDASITIDITINQAQSISNLTIDLASPQIYGTAITPTCLATGEGTPVLTINDSVISSGSPIVVGVGSWTFNCSQADTQNYSQSSNSSIFTITQAVSDLKLELDGSESNASINTGETILLNGTLITGDDEGILTLFNEGTILNGNPLEVSNSTNFPSEGVFNITVTYSDTQNYSTNSTTFYVEVTTPADLEFPIFSDFTEFPSDPATYVPGARYEFNSTVINTNGTVGIEFDETNFTVFNVSDVFNFTIFDLGAGTFNHYWFGWGNGSDENFNSSQVFTYTIDKAGNPLDVLLNGVNDNLTITYPTLSNVTVTGNKTDFNIDVNGTTFISGSDNLLGVGTWFVNVTADSNQNYTNNESDWFITVNQASSSTNLTVDLGSPQDFGTAITPTCITNVGEGTPVLSVNGTVISSGSPVTLGGGSWTLNCTLASTQNYTQSSNATIFTINPIASEVNLTLNHSEGNITITEGDSIYLNGTLITGDPGSTITLYNNGTIINGGASPLANLTTFPGVDFANITIIYTATQNYTQSSETYYVNVTAAIVDNEFPLFSNFVDNNATQVDTGLALINVTIINTNGTVQLEFNGVNFTAQNITNDVYNVTVNLSVGGTFSYYWNAFGNGTSTNYNISDTFFYTINATVPAQRLVTNVTDRLNDFRTVWQLFDTGRSQQYGEMQVLDDNGIVIIDFNPDGNSFILGNLGIGIKIPSEKLDVNGSVNVAENISINNNVAMYVNETCTFVSSPDGSVILEVCNA